MLINLLTPLLALAGVASAHYRLLEPAWRGDSFTRGASQWIYPCANVTETPSSNASARTQWPHTGGSIKINGSHESALTYVNLGLGTNVTNFNISLVDHFNQTGAGVLCLKDNLRTALEQGFKASNISMEQMEGLQGTVQVVQISHGGGALYNCADITFNSSAKVLADDQCQNATGVSGVAITNAGAQQAGSSTPASAASAVRPLVGSGMLAGLVAWALL
ncbi:hypothetical protein CC80DRAFT_487186 [Byssothecium circinans]|uniref:Copper acquisition factor BIM1-like domain-containing protein n=1 Tax=Byssothecium circinans TaxID=147558 RepID=A0A6A5UD47_9PLEO|nr:hypothetical protein CC80DRAFT_487186 [Byssothecium circinans]